MIASLDFEAITELFGPHTHLSEVVGKNSDPVGFLEP
jgi:hypothetical protein